MFFVGHIAFASLCFLQTEPKPVQAFSHFATNCVLLTLTYTNIYIYTYSYAAGHSFVRSSSSPPPTSSLSETRSKTSISVLPVPNRHPTIRPPYIYIYLSSTSFTLQSYTVDHLRPHHPCPPPLLLPETTTTTTANVVSAAF